MPGRKRSSDTIAAMLSSAPPLAPVRNDVPKQTQTVPEVTSELLPGEEVYEATVEEVRPAHLQPVGPEADIGPARRHAIGPPDPDDAGEWDDPDELERFEFQADSPIVKPRRRRDPQYQTLRINAPTAKIMRLQWKAARQIDPMISFTEFATVTVQAGLRALKEQREREAGE